MNIRASEKIEALGQSEIRNMSIECDKVGGINLSQGICDLPLQDVLKEAALSAMNTGLNYYTKYSGIAELRTQIAEKVRSFNNIPCDPEKNVIVSAGATGALYCTCYALFDPGDEILLFQPYYGYHEYTLHALEIRPVYATLTPPLWTFSMEELEGLISSRTRAILLCTPSNPCGKVFTAEELSALAKFAIKHDLIVLTDEIYEYITYDGRTHISPGSLPEIADRTVTISGYSKTYSITGWRIGYAVAEEHIAYFIGLANDLIYVCAPAPLQYGVAEAIRTLDSDYYLALRASFTRKRNMFCDVLNEIGLTPYTPQGAYYVLADISCLPGENSKERVMWMLSHTGVAAVPGDAFYKNSKGRALARFCFAKDIEVLEDACARLRAAAHQWL